MEFSNDRISIRNASDNVVEIDITGPIGGGWFEDGATADELRNELKAIEKLQASKIILNIESLGGLVNHALAMHDLLAQNSAEIEVRINGLTASSATIIAMAGDTIKMSDNALFLVHRASGLGFGHADNVQSASNDLRKVDERIINIYAKRTGKDADQIKDWMALNDGMGEWWSPEEAKANGFIDEVFEPMKMAAQVSSKQLKKAGLPVPKNTAMADEKTMKDRFMAWAKEAFESITNKQKEDETVDVKALVTAEAEKLEAEFTETVETLEARVTELEPLEEQVTDLTNQVETLTNEKKGLTDQIAKLQDKPSGTEANSDPPVDTGIAPKKSPEEQAMDALTNIATRQFRLMNEEDDERLEKIENDKND